MVSPPEDGGPLERRSTVELAAHRLRGQILSGRIAGGTQLRQEKLARDLGVSRAGELLRRFRSAHVGLRLRFAARVEERGIDRLDLGDGGLARRNRVADMQVDPVHAPCD